MASTDYQKGNHAKMFRLFRKKDDDQVTITDLVLKMVEYL